MLWLYQCGQMNSNIGSSATKAGEKSLHDLSLLSSEAAAGLSSMTSAQHNLRQHTHRSFFSASVQRVVSREASCSSSPRSSLFMRHVPATILCHCSATPPEEAFPPCVACMTPPCLLLAEPSASPHWLSGPCCHLSRRRACSARRKGANFGTLVLDKMHARPVHKLG